MKIRASHAAFRRWLKSRRHSDWLIFQRLAAGGRIVLSPLPTNPSRGSAFK